MAVGDDCKVPRSLKIEKVGENKDRYRISFPDQRIGGNYLTFDTHVEKLDDGTVEVAWANFVPDTDSWKNRKVKQAPVVDRREQGKP